jgi:hypothetical protein
VGGSIDIGCSKPGIVISWKGLSDLDQMAVRVAHVAADLSAAVDRRRQEVGAAFAPGAVRAVDVGDANVEEAVDAVWVLWRLECDGRLVVCRAAADVDDDPAVGERNDRRFPVEQYLAAEDAGVEAARALDVRADDEVREGDALAGPREVGHR